jgi:hypothetical protein
MQLIKRLIVNNATASLIETDGEISLEVHPDCQNYRKKEILQYLEAEGVLEEVFAGNPNWEKNPPQGIDKDALNEL